MMTFVTAGSSADDVEVTVFVTTATEGGPLKIVGFKLPSETGGATKPVLQNKSGKEVRNFYIVAAAGNPDSHGAGGSAERMLTKSTMSFHLYSPTQRAIPPGGDYEAADVDLRPPTLARLAKDLRSNCIHIAVILTRVDFADGTTWKLPSEQQQQIWGNSITAESAKACANSKSTEEAVSALQGSGWESPASPSNLADGIVEHYKFACRIHMVDGRQLAMCPW